MLPDVTAAQPCQERMTRAMAHPTCLPQARDAGATGGRQAERPGNAAATRPFDIAFHGTAPSPMSQTLAPRIVDLHDICLARLRDCRDPQTDLLSRQIRDGAWAPTLGTERIT